MITRKAGEVFGNSMQVLQMIWVQLFLLNWWIIAPMSVVAELKMRRFGSHQMCLVTYVLSQFCRNPGLIFLQYFKPNGYFSSNTHFWSDWSLCCLSRVIFTHEFKANDAKVLGPDISQHKSLSPAHLVDLKLYFSALQVWRYFPKMDKELYHEFRVVQRQQAAPKHVLAQRQRSEPQPSSALMRSLILHPLKPTAKLSPT